MPSSPRQSPSRGQDPQAGAIVLAMLAAFERGDETVMLSLLHPEAEFVPMLVATGARRSPYRGHAGFVAYLRDARQIALDVRIEVRDVHQDGDLVVVLARVHGTAAGGALDAPTTYVFRIREGLVVHAVVGSDPEVARQAFGLDDAAEAIPAADDRRAVAPLTLRLNAEPASVPTIRRAVDAYVAALGAGHVLRADIRLAVSEACTNAVLHAYTDRPQGVVRIRVRCVAAVLEIDVEDEGRGLIPRLDSPGLGMGLLLMSRLAGSCTITTPPEREAGCGIRMEFPLAGGAPAPSLS